jgi:hypothetical protein
VRLYCRISEENCHAKSWVLRVQRVSVEDGNVGMGWVGFDELSLNLAMSYLAASLLNT